MDSSASFSDIKGKSIFDETKPLLQPNSRNWDLENQWREYSIVGRKGLQADVSHLPGWPHGLVIDKSGQEDYNSKKPEERQVDFLRNKGLGMRGRFDGKSNIKHCAVEYGVKMDYILNKTKKSFVNDLMVEKMDEEEYKRSKNPLNLKLFLSYICMSVYRFCNFFVLILFMSTMSILTDFKSGAFVFFTGLVTYYQIPNDSFHAFYIYLTFLFLSINVKFLREDLKNKKYMLTYCEKFDMKMLCKTLKFIGYKRCCPYTEEEVKTSVFASFEHIVCEDEELNVFSLSSDEDTFLPNHTDICGDFFDFKADRISDDSFKIRFKIYKYKNKERDMKKLPIVFNTNFEYNSDFYPDFKNNELINGEVKKSYNLHLSCNQTKKIINYFTVLKSNPRALICKEQFYTDGFGDKILHSLSFEEIIENIKQGKDILLSIQDERVSIKGDEYVFLSESSMLYYKILEIKYPKISCQLALHNTIFWGGSRLDILENVLERPKRFKSNQLDFSNCAFRKYRSDLQKLFYNYGVPSPLTRTEKLSPSFAFIEVVDFEGKIVVTMDEEQPLIEEELLEEEMEINLKLCELEDLCIRARECLSESVKSLYDYGKSDNLCLNEVKSEINKINPKVCEEIYSMRAEKSKRIKLSSKVREEFSADPENKSLVRIEFSIPKIKHLEYDNRIKSLHSEMFKGVGLFNVVFSRINHNYLAEAKSFDDLIDLYTKSNAPPHKKIFYSGRKNVKEAVESLKVMFKDFSITEEEFSLIKEMNSDKVSAELKKLYFTFDRNDKIETLIKYNKNTSEEDEIDKIKHINKNKNGVLIKKKRMECSKIVGDIKKTIKKVNDFKGGDLGNKQMLLDKTKLVNLYKKHSNCRKNLLKWATSFFTEVTGIGTSRKRMNYQGYSQSLVGIKRRVKTVERDFDDQLTFLVKEMECIKKDWRYYKEKRGGARLINHKTLDLMSQFFIKEIKENNESN